VHVLVGHPEPDPPYLGGGLLGDVEVNVHVLVVYCSRDWNLQDAIAMSKLLRIPHAPTPANFLKLYKTCITDKSIYATEILIVR